LSSKLATAATPTTSEKSCACKLNSAWRSARRHKRRRQTMSNNSRQWRCDDCRNSFHDPRVTMAPMLHDHVWGRLAHEDEALCGRCMFQRANDRGIELTLADLRPCPSNLFGQFSYPEFSWFKFFAENESGPPQNLAEWREELRKLSPKLLQWTAGFYRKD